jgi:hypothetical protein
MSGVRESVWRPDEHADAISCRITKAWLSDLRGDRPPCTLSNPSTSTSGSSACGRCSATSKRAAAYRDGRRRRVLTPDPVGEGSCVRLKQPKLPEGTWEVTVWDAPSYFEFRQKSGSVTNVAGHRVEALEEGCSRLTLTLDMRGLLVPVVATVLQGPDQPVHDRRGSGHEARSRVRLRREGASRKSPVAVNANPLSCQQRRSLGSRHERGCERRRGVFTGFAGIESTPACGPSFVSDRGRRAVHRPARV